MIKLKQAPRTPGEILSDIADLVTEREEDHGNWLVNMETAAELWSVVLGGRVRGDQVANCLLQLKIARQITSGKTDDYDDAIGYAALAAAWFEHEEKRDS